jgi:uncharacterized protein (DUF697 family)
VALMQFAGLGIRDVLGVVRGAQGTAGSTTSIVVTGVLATELARALRGGADNGSAVRVGGEIGGAAALIVVLGGHPIAEDERVLREAARTSLPVIAVQTDPRADLALAYVPAQAVIVCRAGQGFPVDEIAVALASRLGHDAVPLAARVPSLRPLVARELVRQASLRAAVVGALPWRQGADFPVLALIQARLVLDLAAAHGRALDRELAPELAAVAGSGLGFRALVRRLPRRLPLIGGVTGYLATRALGEAAIKRFATDD